MKNEMIERFKRGNQQQQQNKNWLTSPFIKSSVGFDASKEQTCRRRHKKVEPLAISWVSRSPSLFLCRENLRHYFRSWVPSERAFLSVVVRIVLRPTFSPFFFLSFYYRNQSFIGQRIYVYVLLMPRTNSTRILIHLLCFGLEFTRNKLNRKRNHVRRKHT